MCFEFCFYFSDFIECYLGLVFQVGALGCRLSLNDGFLVLCSFLLCWAWAACPCTSSPLTAARLWWPQAKATFPDSRGGLRQVFWVRTLRAVGDHWPPAGASFLVSVSGQELTLPLAVPAEIGEELPSQLLRARPQSPPTTGGVPAPPALRRSVRSFPRLTLN